MRTRRVSSGISALDGIIGGLRVGDNVIWHMESGSFMEIFSSSFLKVSRRQGHCVVLVGLNASPKTVLDRFGAAVDHPNVTVVDGFTWGKGEGARLFTGYYESVYPKHLCRIEKVGDPQRMEAFIQVINRIEEEMPEGTRYLFDSLTGMSQLWGGEESVLTFFTRQCPRLFELDTIAYWILEKEAHSANFRAQINHITQVAIDLSVKDSAPILTVLKADRRDGSDILHPRAFRVRRSRVEFQEEGRGESPIPIGPRIRIHRLRKGMSQVELARYTGVSASTISQVEGEQILLSLPALVRAARALDVTLDTLVMEDGQRGPRPITPKSQRSRVKLGHFSEQQVVAFALTDWRATGNLEVYELHIQPGAQLQGHFFLNKGEEFGYLMQGQVQVHIQGTDSQMNPGDVIHLVQEIPDRWSNLMDTEARFVWVLMR